MSNKKIVPVSDITYKRMSSKLNISRTGNPLTTVTGNIYPIDIPVYTPDAAPWAPSKMRVNRRLSKDCISVVGRCFKRLFCRDICNEFKHVRRIDFDR